MPRVPHDGHDYFELLMTHYASLGIGTIGDLLRHYVASDTKPLCERMAEMSTQYYNRFGGYLIGRDVVSLPALSLNGIIRLAYDQTQKNGSSWRLAVPDTELRQTCDKLALGERE